MKNKKRDILVKDTLYIYWVDFEGNNWWVATMDYGIEFGEPYTARPIWHIYYEMDTVNKLKSNVYFDYIESMPFDKFTERYFVNVPPLFITDRIPPKGRPDADMFMKEIGIPVYDPWEIIKYTHAVSAGRYMVDTVKNSKYKNDYLHRVSIDMYNSDKSKENQ